MYYCRWCFQPKLKKYYGSQIGAIPQFSGVNKKQSSKSPPSKHFPVHSVFFGHSASNHSIILDIAFLNPEPPTRPKAWKICTMDCGGIVFATMFSSEDHLSNHWVQQSLNLLYFASIGEQICWDSKTNMTKSCLCEYKNRSVCCKQKHE